MAQRLFKMIISFLGLVVVTQALICKVTDDTNQAAGLSFIFFADTIGFILGPSMAGKKHHNLILFKNL